VSAASDIKPARTSGVMGGGIDYRLKKDSDFLYQRLSRDIGVISFPFQLNPLIIWIFLLLFRYLLPALF